MESPPQDQKKPYHHKDLREKLIAAGETLLADRSPEQVTLREIARAAGVSHAAPKHHFSSLGDLLGEIAARGFKRFVTELSEAANGNSSQTPPDRLLAMSRAYLRFAQTNSATYGLMFGKRDRCSMTPHLVTASIAAWSQLETAVNAVVRQNNASPGALMVWSTVHGLAMLVLEQRTPPNITPATAIEPIMRMVLAGIKAES